jgi:hypothetical protein
MELWHPRALQNIHTVHSDGYWLQKCYVYGCLTTWCAADKRHTYFDLMTQFSSKILNFWDVPVVRIHICTHFGVHMYVLYVSNPSDVNYACLWCIGSYSYTCLWKLIFSKFWKSENSEKNVFFYENVENFQHFQKYIITFLLAIVVS